MSKHRKWNTIRDEILADPERAERVELHRQVQDAVLALSEIRASRGVTQTQLAEAWEVSQANVSRVERERDVYLSTLRGYVEALGGRLELAAVFDDDTVRLAVGLPAREAELA